jgi:hypothetical protein
MMRHPVAITDTDPRAMKVWMDLLRSKTPGERIEIAFNLTEFALRMAESGVRARYPGAGEREIFLRCAALRLPGDLMIRAYGWDPEVLDRLEVPYYVGGSVASSAHGVPRTTLNVDLVVDLKAEQIEAFAAELEQEFYVDAAMERQWNDLRGVVNAGGGQLDVDYLRRWACELNVGDLLDSLLGEFGM